MSYRFLPRNPYFDFNCGLDREIKPAFVVTFTKEIDFTEIELLRASWQKQTGVKPSYTAFVAKAAAAALRKHPYANRVDFPTLGGRRIVQFEDVNVSIGAELDEDGKEQAAFVGTIYQCDRKDFSQVTEELRALANANPETYARLRGYRTVVEKLPGWLARRVIGLPGLSPRLWLEHRGGSLIISSPGKYGPDSIHGSWPWPLGLSFGCVQPRPFVVNGEVCARRTSILTLAFDRRLWAGGPAARFFATLCEALTSPRNHFVEFRQQSVVMEPQRVSL